MSATSRKFAFFPNTARAESVNRCWLRRWPTCGSGISPSCRSPSRKPTLVLWRFTAVWISTLNGCLMPSCGRDENQQSAIGPSAISESIMEQRGRRGGAGPKLSPQHPHHPACHQRSTQEHGETIESVADHLARGLAMGDAENNRREHGKDDRCAEVVKSDGHENVTRYQGLAER